MHSPIEENGFAIIPSVLSQEEISGITRSLAEAPLRRGRAGIRHALKHPVVANVARDARLLQIAEETLGKAATAFRATLFDKAPSANWLVAWHQDTALPLRERRELPGWGPWSVKEGVNYAHAPASVLNQIVAIRVHLDDSTMMNGPLRVLAGTHKLGLLDDETIHKLAAQMPAVECLVPQGGVLVMRPLVVHASSKSQGEEPRRVLHIEYAASVVIEGLELAAA